MNANKALWEKGDFTKIADTMRESGTNLINNIGVSDALTIMDLGCGDGTTAIPAARLGANVTGVDIASNLVAAGNQRAIEENLTNCKFQEGDAQDLSDHADDSYDLSISIFGAMFAPNPYDVAKEMVRVTRPGGHVVMGNWIPNDPTLVAQILKTSAAHTPPPPKGFISPMTWGVEEKVIERFEAAGIQENQISFLRDTFTFTGEISADELLNNFKQYYGPTMNAFDAAKGNGSEAELESELRALFNSQNQSAHAEHIEIPATFLRVTVQV